MDQVDQRPASRERPRLPKWVLALGGGSAVAWLILAYGVGPWLIRRAYEERSFSFLNDAFEGRSIHPVSRYLGAWSDTVIKVHLSLLGAALVAFLFFRYWREIKAAFSKRGWQPVTFPAAMWVAAWFGWITGITNIAFRAVPRTLSQSPTGPFEVEWWGAPLMGMLLGVALGTLIWIAARRGDRGQTVHPVASAGVAMLAYSLLDLGSWGVHRVALLVLAIGVGANLSRPFVSWGERFLTLTRRTVPVMLAATLVTALGMTGLRTYQERSGRAALGMVPQGAKNVLLLILDTARAQNMSLYGAERRTTPNLDRLSSSATVFDFALAPTPWTLPSHASYFTGLDPNDHEANWNLRLTSEHETLAEALGGHGYHTGGFTANRTYTARRSGLSQGFHRYRDSSTPRTVAMALPFATRPVNRFRMRMGRWDSPGHRPAEAISAEFLSWLDTLDDDRPFFGFLNYFDAHAPYNAGELKGTFVGPDARYWMGEWLLRPNLTEQDLFELEGTYDEAYAYIDQQIAALLDELERRGKLENTLIVVTSDHGELFGEHGLTDHGKSVYHEVLWVPLMIIDPAGDAPRGVRVQTRVSTLDLPSTILELARVPAEFPGSSLSRYWLGQTDPEPMLTQVNKRIPWWTVRGVHDGDWSYMWNFEGPVEEELYDLSTDWEELDNLAANPTDSTARVLDHMRGLLEALDPAAERCTTLMPGQC